MCQALLSALRSLTAFCCLLVASDFSILWTSACQVSLSFTISRSLLKLMSMELVMPSNHLTLCCPFSSLQPFPASGSFLMSCLQYFACVAKIILAMLLKRLLCVRHFLELFTQISCNTPGRCLFFLTKTQRSVVT